MNYRDKPELCDRLAAEYVLGTLGGAARRRFARWLRDDAALRLRVSDWESRLTPMAESVTPVQPPARVWKAIEARIASPARTRAASPGFDWNALWANLAFWRGVGMVSLAATVLLGAFLLLAPPPPVPVIAQAPVTPPRIQGKPMMAVLSDDNRQVAMTVSWMPQPAGERVVKIHILQDHPEMPDHTSWELWVIPHGSDKPVSMGFVTLAREQVLKLKPEAAKVLETAAVIALSLEPEKGSPTGLPTGPVLFKGPCLTVST